MLTRFYVKIPRIEKAKFSISSKEKLLFETLLEHLAGTEVRVAGGWVRDKLLGLSSDDIDITLNNMTGIEAAEKLKRSLQDASSIGKTKINPEASKHLETACMRIFGYSLDLANLRTESYASSRIPEVVIFTQSFGSPAEDANRRDLTINSLFYNIAHDTVEDWTGFGLCDLESKLARTPLDARVTMQDDPLRILRVIRFTSRFGLQLDKDLLQVLNDKNIHEWILKKVSRERIRIEFEKMMECKNSEVAVQLLEKFELFSVVFMLKDLKVQNCLKKIPCLNEKKWKFEKFVSSFLHHFVAKTLKIRGKEVEIGTFVCKNSLKLSKKQEEIIKNYLIFLPELEKLSEKFDPAAVGLIIRELGEDWEEILDLLPSECSKSLLSSIQQHSLEFFWKEAVLFRVNLIRETS